jgi:hypothetical protein
MLVKTFIKYPTLRWIAPLKSDIAGTDIKLSPILFTLDIRMSAHPCLVQNKISQRTLRNTYFLN